MSGLIKWFARPLGVQLLVTSLAFFALPDLASLFKGEVHFFIQKAAAEASQEIPRGWESYLERPDILKIQAQAQNLEASWKPLKDAHFSFVAELLALYSQDTNIYFLARDSEHLYDVARLVTEGTADAKRIHLLNVSRANMRNPSLKAYLKENGISEETLKAGRKILFVDTGFSGTIPRVIGENYSRELRIKIKTHLVVSSNPDHPSSRSFLVHLNPSTNEQNPSGMHGTIVSYEHMPRYTDRSSQFSLSEGRLHPISPIGKSSDGSVSKEKSLQYMSDLKAEWQKTETKARYQLEKTQIEMIKKMLLDGSEASKSDLKVELIKQKSESLKGRLFEAQIRDLMESQINADLHFKIKLEDLNLKATVDNRIAVGSKKNELIEKYPEWAPVLENPDSEIPKLFNEKNWLMIGNLIDANVDMEINKLLIKSLFDASAQGAKKDMQIQMIEKGNSQVLLSLVLDIFSRPHAQDMKDLIKLVIEKGDTWILASLAQYIFSQPQSQDMKELIKLVIEKGDMTVLGKLSRYTFSKPHTRGMKDLIKLVIEKGEVGVLTQLAENTFSQPHTQDMTDLLKLVIEKGHPLVLAKLEEYTFSKPHTRTPEHLILRASLKISNSQERKAFIETQMQKINSSLVQLKESVDTKPITASLQVGDTVVVQNRHMKVLKKAGEGKRGVVFQVQAEDNKAFYALKAVKNQDPDTLNSLAQESSKAKKWQELGIPHSKVLVQDKDYVLKVWIEGVNGEQVVQNYVAGDASYKASAENILKLVEKIRAQGAYVGDFRPANLIWSGKAWVIIDSGSIQQGMTLEEAQAKWNQSDENGSKFERRWKMQIPPAMCSKVHQKAG